jgi:hypothetical protein
MCCNFSHEKALKEEETLLQDGTIDTRDVESTDFWNSSGTTIW